VSQASQFLILTAAGWLNLQVIDHVLLLLIHPAGQRHKDQLDCVHLGILAASQGRNTLRNPFDGAPSTD